MVPPLPEQRPFYADLLYKLGAVGLAVILWFFSISNSQFEADAEFRIEIRNIREGKTLSEETPRTAVLRFRGTGRSLAKFFLWRPFSDAKLVLDLERVQQRHVFYLDEYLRRNPQRISIPIVGIQENLRFVEVVRPDSILIELGDYEEILVPVRPQVTLDLAPGYTQVGNWVITPSMVLVKGLAEAVAQVSVIRSMRQTYRDVAAPLEIHVGLLHPAPRQVLVVEPVNVKIEVDIQMIGERRLEEVPVRVINIPDNLNVFVSPSTVALTVIGGVDFLADNGMSVVEVLVDYRTQWSPTNLFIEPQVQLDPSVIEYRDLVPKQLELITIRQSL